MWKREGRIEFPRAWKKVSCYFEDKPIGLESIWLRNVGQCSDDNRMQEIKFEMFLQGQIQTPSTPSKEIPFLLTLNFLCAAESCHLDVSKQSCTTNCCVPPPLCFFQILLLPDAVS